MYSSTAFAFVASLSTALATPQGFNYASTFTSGAVKQQSDFQSEFTNAKGLAGTNGGFTSARLYTMIQSGTTSDVISAIPAALAVPGTELLLGMWASGGQSGLDVELAALKSAIATYGTSLAKITSGISVGSEDLYRESPTGIENLSGVGADAATVASYIAQVKHALADTPLQSVPVGHVDTWTAWVNGSNSAAITASDFIGMDAYPYFQNTFDNPIDQGKTLFLQAFDATKAVAQGKPVWVTETGWPVSGKTENLAIPSTSNAKTYWDQVGCPLFGNTPTYWYTLEDADSTTPNPSFGVITSASNKPLYDLSCSKSSSSSSASSSTSSSAAVSSGTAPASTSASALASASASTSTASSGFVASGTAVSTGGFGSSNSTSGSGSGGFIGYGSSATASSGAAGSTGVAGSTGKSGPTPTSTATFTGGAVTNAGSALGVLTALIAVLAFVL